MLEVLLENWKTSIKSLNNCDPAISLSDGAVKRSSVETLDNRDFFLDKFKITYVVFT